MKLSKAIEIIEYYQSWRSGHVEESRHSPTKIGRAIDKILKTVKKVQTKKQKNL